MKLESKILRGLTKKAVKKIAFFKNQVFTEIVKVIEDREPVPEDGSSFLVVQTMNIGTVQRERIFYKDSYMGDINYDFEEGTANFVPAESPADREFKTEHDLTFQTFESEKVGFAFFKLGGCSGFFSISGQFIEVVPEKFETDEHLIDLVQWFEEIGRQANVVLRISGPYVEQIKGRLVNEFGFIQTDKTAYIKGDWKLKIALPNREQRRKMGLPGKTKKVRSNGKPGSKVFKLNGGE